MPLVTRQASRFPAEFLYTFEQVYDGNFVSELGENGLNAREESGGELWVADRGGY